MRYLVKLSGELMNACADISFDKQAIEDFTDRILDLHAKGYEIVIVVGGGNIRRGRDMVDLGINQISSDYLGMTATIMNAVVLSEIIKNKGGKTVVFSPSETQIPDCTRVYRIQKAQRALEKGHIVFCAGGIFQPFATTDSAAVQRALELGCDMVVKATKVDGVYDKDPTKHDDAVKFDALTFDQAIIKNVGIMDQQAFALARSHNMPLYVCHQEDLALLGTNDMKGTCISKD